MADRLFAASAGAGDPPIVLLHGFGGHHGIWDAVVAPLEPRWRTLAYDLPGHGRSLGHPARGAAKSAHEILADLAERGIERFHLAGHSMGGATAALMAIAVPARVVTLTLIAPGGMGPEINGPLLTRYAAAVEAEDLRHCMEAMRVSGAAVADKDVERLVHLRRLAGQRDALMDVVTRMIRDGRQGVIPGDALARLEMPVQVLWGDCDAVLPAAQAANLPKRFAVHRLSDVGHMIPEEAPTEVAAVLAKFCR